MADKKLPRRPGGPKPLPPPPRPPARSPKRPGSAAPSPPAAVKPARPRSSGPPPRRVRRSSGSSRSWLKRLLVGLLAILLLAAAAGGYLFYELRRSLPQVEGASKLEGLTAPVEVLRDRYGVPHLFGADLQDLSRAMGYVHAQDRWFQMELARRLGSGRLAEILGAGAVEPDRIARRFGFAAAAEAELNRMTPEAREVIEAYAGGVNAYLSSHADRLPPEFRILDLAPAPWQPADSLVIGKWMAYALSSNGRVEVLRRELAGAVGFEAAYRLTGLEPPPSPPGEAGPVTTARVSSLEERANRLVPLPSGASNAWAVSGARSSTGRPLLASDPHLSLGMPSIWYEVHLSGGGLDVAGASLPGVPLVLIGQNRRIAWGITALFADVQDVFVETLNPENPLQYATPDGYLDLDVVRENILVKDGSPAIEEVRISRHGVVIGETSDGKLLAQQWTSLWTGDHLAALIALNRAGSWQEFTEALRTWASPALSFLYADIEGNIGFFPAGEVPLRLAHDGTFPADGASGSFEWGGSIPHELKPMVFNPQDGILVSANQTMLPPDTPYPLGADTLAPLRADRIRHLLQTLSKSSADDFARIQDDRYDPSTEEILRLVVALRPQDPASVRAVEKLRGWNGQMTAGPAPAIFQALHLRLIENTFRDELGDGLFQSYLEFLELGHRGGIFAVLGDESSPFWDDRRTPEVETRERVLLSSLEQAVALLTERAGANLDDWDWRRLHAVRFEHPLGAREPLDKLFNRGPSPFGGSTHTIANASVSLREPFETALGTSYRLVADLSDPPASRSTIPTGQSGHPLSPHYFDLNSGWLEGRGHELLFERSAIESALGSKLTLQP